MTPTTITDIILGLLPFIVGYATLRMSSRSVEASSRVQAREVDAAAFERARVIYEGAIDQLETELAAVRRERDHLVVEIRRLSGINDELERQLGTLAASGGEIDRLRSLNQQLQARLHQLGGSQLHPLPDRVGRDTVRRPKTQPEGMVLCVVV